MTGVVRKRFPREAASLAGSRQQRGELPFAAIASIQRDAFALYAGASVIFLSAGLAGVALASRELHVFSWVALAINAAVCGLSSGPFPRYQSRVVWLVAFACLASAWEIVGHRGPTQLDVAEASG